MECMVNDHFKHVKYLCDGFNYTVSLSMPEMYEPNLVETLNIILGTDDYKIQKKPELSDSTSYKAVIVFTKHDVAEKAVKTMMQTRHKHGCLGFVDRLNAEMIQSLDTQYVQAYWNAITDFVLPFVNEHEQKIKTIKETKPIDVAKLEELEKQKTEFGIYWRELKLKIVSKVGCDTIQQDIPNLASQAVSECQKLKSALPIYAERSKIVKTISDHRVCVILGETGSGKSTQLAQYVYSSGLCGDDGLIACTQPRKIAAISLAKRVAEELGTSEGDVVGYKVGLKEKRSANTKILYMTDHVLLKECVQDRRLSKYSCVIIDEAHERSIYTDLLLGMLKQAARVRLDLKIIITSATIDPKVFVRYFDGCPVLRVSGRTFPVEVIWRSATLPPVGNPIEASIEQVIEIDKHQKSGDILVFLTSPVDTEKASNMLREKPCSDRLLILQLHGRLNSDEQQKVFQPPPPGKRKVVFATNSAETSITIGGIRYVVDSGLVKEKRYDHVRNMSSLEVASVTKSSAEQRKGRAGRVEDGICYRLYTEAEYEAFTEITEPEIMRVHLGQAILQLMLLGIADPISFDFVQSPPVEALLAAKETLKEIGAINSGGLTEVGRNLAKLSIEPRRGKLVLCGYQKGIGMEAVIITAILIASSGGSIFFRMGTDEEKREADMRKSQLCDNEGDIISALNIFKKWKSVAKKDRGKWCVDNSINGKVMKVAHTTVKDICHSLRTELNIRIEEIYAEEAKVISLVPELLLMAFPSNLAHYTGHKRAGYIVDLNKTCLHVHPSSVVSHTGIYHTWVVYIDTLVTNQSYMLHLSAIPNELVKSFADTGRIHDWVNEVEKFVLERKDITNVGPFVMSQVTGKRFSAMRKLQDELQADCIGPCVVFDVDMKRSIISIFAARTDLPMAERKVCDRVQHTKNMLKNDCIEEGVGNDHLRLIVGAGGEIQEILAADQYRSVQLFNVARGYYEDDIRRLFSMFGHVVRVERDTQENSKKQRSWGFVMFADQSSALEAAQHESIPDVVKRIAPRKVSTSRIEKSFTARITWTRRFGKGFAFVPFHDETQCRIAMDMCRCHGIQASLNKKTTSELYIRGIHKDWTEKEVQKRLNDALRSVNIEVAEKDVRIAREQAPVGQNNHQSLQKQLARLIADCGVQRKDFSVTITQPENPKYVYYTAYANFTDAVLRTRVVESINEGKELVGSKLRLVEESRWFISREVYNVICEDIKTLLESFARDQVKFEIDASKKAKTHVKIDVFTNSTEVLQGVSAGLARIQETDSVDCSPGAPACQLLSVGGNDFISKLSSETKTYIAVDHRSQSLSIAGNENQRKKALDMINDYLRVMETTVTSEIPIAGKSVPRGFIQALVKEFGHDFKKLSQKAKLISIVPDFYNHQLRLHGTEKAVQDAISLVTKVMKTISEVGTSLPVENEDQECSLCWVPIEKRTYKLEYCAHCYCMECITALFDSSVKDKKFPLICAVEECSEAFTIRDINTLIGKKEAMRKTMLQFALDSFISTSNGKYHYCKTPDCPLVYATSSKQQPVIFTCPECRVNVCTGCHGDAHRGVSCDVAERMKNDPDFGLNEWIKGDSHNRGVCPSCKTAIEKTAGCLHMTCGGCKQHVCWRCKKAVFDTDKKCYEHLGKCGSGLYDDTNPEFIFD